MCRSGSLTSSRTRSAAATPPGSRSSSAPGSASARPVASVVLPAPSRPSMVTSGIGAEPYDAHLMLPGLERHPHARAVLRLDAPSHAYLFHGPAGAGKREVARAFAAELLADGAADPSSARARLSLGDGEKGLGLALGTGPGRRAAAERFARTCLCDDLGDRPWKALLEDARRAGEQAVQETEGRVAAELEVTATRDRRRVEREGAERARRASRRASTAALDHGLQLAGLWLRDVACVADGAEDVAHGCDRLAELRSDAAGRDAHALRAGVDAVEDTRQRLVLNVSEELALEALAYRLARLLS